MKKAKFSINAFFKDRTPISSLNDIMSLIEEHLLLEISEIRGDLSNPKNITEAIDIYNQSDQEELLIIFEDKDNNCIVKFGYFDNKSSINFDINHSGKTNKSFLNHLKDKILSEIHMSSLLMHRIRFSNNQEEEIIVDRNIPQPSNFFGALGTEWYALISPEKWQPQYDLDVLLNAPCKPKLLGNDYIEWYLYDDPLQFDIKKARENVIYLGENRKRKPLFPLKKKSE